MRAADIKLPFVLSLMFCRLRKRFTIDFNSVEYVSVLKNIYIYLYVTVNC